MSSQLLGPGGRPLTPTQMSAAYRNLSAEEKEVYQQLGATGTRKHAAGGQAFEAAPESPDQQECWAQWIMPTLADAAKQSPECSLNVVSKAESLPLILKDRLLWLMNSLRR